MVSALVTAAAWVAWVARGAPLWAAVGLGAYFPRVGRCLRFCLVPRAMPNSRWVGRLGRHPLPAVRLVRSSPSVVLSPSGLPRAQRSESDSDSESIVRRGTDLASPAPLGRRVYS